MAGTIVVSHTKNETIIQVSGRFDYAMLIQFRTAYKMMIANNDNGCSYVVDLALTEHIDSSALGMLLMLHKEANINDTAPNISIINSSSEVQRILITANFQRIFKID